MEDIIRMYNSDIQTEQARRFFRAYYSELNLDEKSRDDVQMGAAPASGADGEGRLISVIIPAFNRKEMLTRAVDSVLAQDYPRIEIIIINDCSTDGTREYLAALSGARANVKVIHNETHMDPGSSRRLGYLASSGEYIIFLDDDDYYFDNLYFRKAVQKHLEYRDLAFVGANAFNEKTIKGKLFTKNLNKVGLVNRADYLKNFQNAYKKPSSLAGVFNKSMLEEAGLRDMRMMDDAAIYLRALLTGDAYLLEDIVGVRVLHETNFSRELDIPFIIRTIEEKRWVWAEENRRNSALDPSWMNYQIFFTFQYFIKISRPRLKDYVDIMRWTVRNAEKGKGPLILKLNRVFAGVFCGRAKNWLGARRRALQTIPGRFRRESAVG